MRGQVGMALGGGGEGGCGFGRWSGGPVCLHSALVLADQGLPVASPQGRRRLGGITTGPSSFSGTQWSRSHITAQRLPHTAFLRGTWAGGSFVWLLDPVPAESLQNSQFQTHYIFIKSFHPEMME